MHGRPDDMELEEMILNDMGTSDPSILYKTIRSWEQVHTKGTKLGKRMMCLGYLTNNGL